VECVEEDENVKKKKNGIKTLVQKFLMLCRVNSRAVKDANKPNWTMVFTEANP